MHSVAKWNQSGRPLKLVSLVVSVSACLLLGSSGFEHVERGDAMPLKTEKKPRIRQMLCGLGETDNFASLNAFTVIVHASDVRAMLPE